jgi:hypothetical protein
MTVPPDRPPEPDRRPPVPAGPSPDPRPPRGPGPGLVVGIALVAGFLVVNGLLAARGRFTDPQTGAALSVSETLGVMLAAGLTLAIYSFLYKDNPLFKLAEHLFLGVSVGYGITITVHQYLAKQLYAPLIEPLLDPAPGSPGPRWTVLIPVGLGLCMLARFVPRWAWISRYAFAMLVGWGAGLMVPYVLYGYIFKQTRANLTPLQSGLSAGALFSTAVVLVGVISVLVYFFFSIRHRGPLKITARTGLIYLMIAFGATFGFTVMARISLLTGRAMFLLRDWLHLVERAP